MCISCGSIARYACDLFRDHRRGKKRVENLGRLERICTHTRDTRIFENVFLFRMSGVVQMIARTTHHQTCTSNRAVGSIDSRVLSSVLKLFALVLLFVGTMGQKNARPAGAGDSASAATTHISPPATALTAFGIRLLKEMAPDDETVGNNVFISPW